MIIESFSIKAFKSVIDQTIDLGNINIFIGANGSGKSNILEALGILSAAASGRVDDESLLRRGVRPGRPRLYKSSFQGLSIAPHIFFEATSKSAGYAVSLNNPLDNPRPAWSYKTEKLTEAGIKILGTGPRINRDKARGLAALEQVKLEEDSPASMLLDGLREYAIFSPNTLTLRGLVSDNQTREPIGLSGGNLAEAVRVLRSSVRRNEAQSEAWDAFLELIDWVQGLETTESVGAIVSPSVQQSRLAVRFRDRFMRAGKNTLTGYDASEGALYVLFYAVLVLAERVPPILAIDNLDAALNPRLVTGLMRTICETLLLTAPDRQILATLHNPAALDGLPLDDDRVRLFAVDRNNKGHTVVTRIELDDRLRQLSEEKGWPLSRLWVMGHLGGVPDNV